MKLFVLVSILAIFPFPLRAQPEIDAFNLYDRGNTPADLFADIYQAANGDFLVCGQSNYRSWVMRIDPEGRQIWEYMPNEGARLFSLVEADNGDVLAAGTPFGAFRLTSDGELIWRRVYLDGRSGRACAIIELKEGDFLLSGTTGAGGVGYVTRIDGNGDQIWERRYNDGGMFWGMRQTEGGIVLCGQTDSRGWVKKIDLEGETIWTRNNYNDGLANQWFTSMVSIPRGFALGAFCARNQRSYAEIVIINGNGEMLNNYVIEDVEGVFCEGIAKSDDGSFVLVGQQTIGQRHYPVCIRVAQNGQFQWTKNFHEIVDQLRDGVNSLYSAIILPGDVIVASGTLYNNFANLRDDALIVRFTPDPMYPAIFYKSPEDSLQTVLRGESLEFIVRARDRFGREPDYEWYYGDSLLIRDDTTVTVAFDTTLGDYSIMCHISNGVGEVRTGWNITVTDLYISAFTPDTLDLTLRRGSSVDFSLDTVRYIGEEEPEYLWTKSNLSNGEQQDFGTEAGATIDFPWSGDYTVEGRAYRGQSSDQVTWNVAVRGAIWAYVPEALAFDVEPESVVHFEVVPSEPENESLSIQWLVDGEVTAEDTVALDWSFAGSADLNTHYQVSAVVADSVEADTVTWDVTVRDLGVGDGGQDALPTDFGLLSVSPNPFNSMLTIRYAYGLDKSAPTRLAIYDLSGRLVADLLDMQGGLSYGEEHPPFNSPPASGGGKHSVVWDALAIPAGVYLVRLENGAEISTRKVVLMR